jgi:hypothetical protein
MYVQSEFVFSKKLAAAVHTEYRSTGGCSVNWRRKRWNPNDKQQGPSAECPGRARGCKSHEDLAVSIEPSRYGPEAESGYEQQGRP